MNNWQPKEYLEGPSIWGHERTWLSPADRERAREMRMQAAADGFRKPVQVVDGNFERMSGACPWWDSVTATAPRALNKTEGALDFV